MIENNVLKVMLAILRVMSNVVHVIIVVNKWLWVRFLTEQRLPETNKFTHAGEQGHAINVILSLYLRNI